MTSPLLAGDPVGDRIDMLLKQYSAAWLALARESCGDHHHAEDALVEALFNLNQAMVNGGVENPVAWMSTAIRRRASERYRKETAQHNLRDRLVMEAAAKPDPTSTPPLPSDPEDPENTKSEADPDGSFIVEPGHWQAIKDSLPRLPERQREVIRLRLFEKLSIQEIAEYLNCSEAAARNAQHKAIRGIKTFMAKQNDG